jgi:hypothetical protein
MADDSRFRSTRPGSSYGRPDKSAQSSDDPLAELARLIGKNDPYAEFGLRERRAAHEQEGEPAEGYARDDTYADPHYASAAQRHQPQQYDHDPRSDEYYQPSQDPPPVHAPRAEEWASDRYEHRDSRYDSAAPEDAYAHSEGYDHHDAHEREHGAYDSPSFDEDRDQMYDDPPRARRHGGLATALALIGCAVLGTAGAYAYRSYHGQSAAAEPPPVITADTSTPTKIVPAPGGDPQASKFVQDRLANAAREQVVSKQEEPIALKDLGTQGAARVVLPPPVAAAPPAGAAVPGPNEPKKVQTVTIRPDGSDVSGKPPAAPSSRSGPLSLEPQSAAPPPPAPPRTRTVTAPAPSTDSTGASAASGGFLVQLASQKTETEAAASFRSLQAKFPNELGGRRPIIRRADLGAKGVFYRTMVGPFASAQEANQFCSSYKAAGGHCVVPTH